MIEDLLNKPLVQWTLRDVFHLNGIIVFWCFVFYVLSKLARLIVKMFARNGKSHADAARR